jgi:hypothetical protein
MTLEDESRRYDDAGNLVEIRVKGEWCRVRQGVNSDAIVLEDGRLVFDRTTASLISEMLGR